MSGHSVWTGSGKYIRKEWNYDSIISNYFSDLSDTKFPNKKVMYGNLIEKLSYGENPHQEGAIYSSSKKLKIHKFNIIIYLIGLLLKMKIGS